SQTALPIYFWTRVMQNENNKDELARLTNEFISSGLLDDLYKNRTGRYGILIYQSISKNDLLKELSDSLLQLITHKLKNDQVSINTETASRSLLVKRTWYRFLYAYSNSLYADIALKKGNNKEAGEYFKAAFDYSPDLKDNNNYSAYFYDMHFLLEKEKKGFQDEYFNYLTQHSTDTQQALTTLLKTALTDPSYKAQLQSFYNKNSAKDEAFSEYWIKNINATAKNAPALSIKKRDGVLFSAATNRGKWILIDFWGTWCAPCREEHPDLEKFYQSIKTLPGNKITLLTVACNDDKEKVAAYMSNFKYTFPVAMADDKIEKAFNINSYPSKILITPQNKYLVIPFGIDWIDFIKKYADL
ncbi:MAG TPA: TlpA disulfide reductase family protein, partial [Chitinophagaceae bacterium]|nr:TlpA disulfide reductase family protein [Chitinophagaceae bacterium]